MASLPFFKPSSFLAIDIGTTSIKIGEFSSESPPQLINYGILESQDYLEESGVALQTSSFRLLEPLVVDYIRKLLRRMNTRSTMVLASLASFSAFSALVEMPKMSTEETAQAIPFQSKQYIPAPLSSVTIDWSPVGERENSEGVAVQQIFLISVANEVIEKYKRIFRALGLRLTHLELENVSFARLLKAESAKPTLIIDIGARSTSMTVIENGALRGVLQTDFAGGSLTHALSSGLNITARRAEIIKIQQGLLGEGGEKSLSTLIKPMLDVILNEAKRAAANFEEAYGRRISRTILTGGGSRLMGIVDYFSRELNLPVAIADPLSRVAYPAPLVAQKSELGPILAAVCGLALRGLTK